VKAFVILNPYSARWKARERWPEAEAALREAGIDFDMVETTGPEDGVHQAAKAAREGYSPVIAAGGDGTFGEVANGLYRVRPEGVLGPMGIMPLGTANDLPVNLGMSLDLRQAARVIAAGKTRRIDLGKASLFSNATSGQTNEWVFDNNSAVGLEPVVTLYNTRMVKLKGVIRYLVAALRAINEGPAWSARLVWDDGEYQGPISLVSVGNCAITGGLFRMAPAADPADGRLTFVHAYAKSRLKMLALLPRTISGSFVDDPVVHQHHTRRLEIELDPVSPIQIDGELRSETLTRVVYEVLPDRLEILTA
jgi:diacylglycerol kinase (ATP)